MKKVLSEELLKKMDAYWRASNYLAVAQIYLLNNPLLKRPLKLSDTKCRLLGHWGTSPGLNFIYVHLNRIISERDLNLIYITGPGHGAPAIIAQTYLEGTYSEFYPDVTKDEKGLQKLFKQFSFPGGIPSHVAPNVPGSINEGGELGYSLAHAFGAVYDNPDLIAACVIGDGEAETATLATSWHSNKFLNPQCDGAVLPILHLNGYKISNPTVLARIPRKELKELFLGYGYEPYFIEGHEHKKMHQLLAGTLDRVFDRIKEIQRQARTKGFKKRPVWPMIVFNSPKGWTCPKKVDGLKMEGTWRAHQVPITNLEKKGHLKLLEKWMKSYRPKELFDDQGRFINELANLAPKGTRRMSANPNANGGLLLKDLKLPDFKHYAVKLRSPGKVKKKTTYILGEFLRDVIKNNSEKRNFRLFGPDETKSNRLDAVFEATDRVFTGMILRTDESIAPEGSVMEVLSENLCQGWLEGYLLTGRHGFFNSYEAFIHIVDSMFNQHAKWIKSSKEIGWRRPIASLNYLLTSHVWRQDHNGFTHQDPGFIDVVTNKKASIVRVYLPPDANTLLSVADHCLRSRNYVNVIIAGKQNEYQWLNIEDAMEHCKRGISIWQWACTNQGKDPEVVLASAGDVPTMETLAAIEILHRFFPSLNIRYVNVVDLMTLQPITEHPHGLTEDEYDSIFTKNKHIIFAFHGYPWLIHRLTYRHTNQNLHVRGYIDEGTTTTPFDMTVLNKLDRFDLVKDVIERVPRLKSKGKKVIQWLDQKLAEHKEYISIHGEDMPEIKDWKWTKKK